MPVEQVSQKDALIDVLNELSREQVIEVFHFALFIKEHFKAESDKMSVKTIPAVQLNALVGAVAWGGDALQDTEHLYEQ